MPPKKVQGATIEGLVPYFAVGNGEEAITFYEKAFGAVTKATLRDDKSITHCEMVIGSSARIMFADENENWKSYAPPHFKGTTVKMILVVDDCDKAFERAQKAGAEEISPPTDYFWGERSAKIADPFGHEWCFSQKTEDVSDKEMGKRYEEFKAKMEKDGDGAKEAASAPAKKKIPAKKAAAAKKVPAKKAKK